MPGFVGASTSLPFESDFEVSEGFSPGILVSDPDWMFNPNHLTVEIIDTDAASDTQSLLLSGAGNFRFEANDMLTTSVRWVDFYVKPVFMEASTLPASIHSMQSAVTAFVKNGAEGRVYVIDGDGQGSGTWVSSEKPITLLGETSNDWIRLTYRLDYHEKRWDLFVNGDLVRIDLGFLDDAFTKLESFALKPDGMNATGFDFFAIQEVNPLFFDASGDGLPDDWLTEHGLDPTRYQRHEDADNTSISNIQAYFLGLSPTNPDTDGDGVHDGLELRLGTDPLVPGNHSLNAIPFVENFESAALGSVDGINLWTLESGHAVVQQNEVFEGAQALSLSAGDLPAKLSNRFNGSGHAHIWVDFRIKPVFWGTGDGPDISELVYAPLGVFYFREDGKVAYLNGDRLGGGTWETVDVVLNESQWHRVTVYNDYAAQKWSLWLNGVRVAQDIGFAHPQPYFHYFAIQQDSETPAYLDELTAALVEPTALDNDGDGLINDWERAHSAYGFDPDNAYSLDPEGLIHNGDWDFDGDGLSVLEELALGTSFNNPDTDGDGLLDGIEVFHGEDPLVPGIYNALAADSDGILKWSTSFESSEGYTVGVVDGQNLWRSSATDAAVSDAAAQSGVQSLTLGSAGAEPVMAYQIIATPQAATTVWVSFHAQLNAGSLPQLGDPSGLGVLLLSRNADGNVAVVDGTTLEWVDTGHPLADGVWTRIDGKLDYVSKTFDVYVNGTQIVSDFGFINQRLPVFSSIQFEQDITEEAQPARFDSIQVSTAQPQFLWNWADVPDWWKQQIVDADPNDGITTIADVLPGDSFDGDSRSNLEEYYLGTLPTVADDDVQYYAASTQGENTYNGRSAVPGQPTVLHGPKATVSAALAAAQDSTRILIQPGTYTETTLSLNGKNLTIRPVGNVTLTPTP